MSKIPLKELCTLVMGQSPSSESYNKEKRGLPFYQGNADFGTLHPVKRIWCDAPKKLAYEGNILISVRAPIGAINIAEETCSIGRGLAAIVPNLEKCDLTYLFYALRASCQYLKNKGTGSTFKAINKDALENLPLPNYDKKKQYMIGKKLQQIDGLSDKYKGQIDLLNVLVQSRFIEMFGDPNRNQKQLEVKFLGEVCTVERGGSPRPIVNYITDSADGVNWIKIGDTDGTRYISKTAEKISLDGVKKSRFVKVGDLILSNSMSFGHPYILKIDGCIHDGWLVLHFDKNIFDALYLQSYLESPIVYAMFEKMAAGGVVNNLNSKIVKELPILIPNIKQQERFALFVNQVDKSKYRGEESRHFLGICYKMVMNMI